LHHLPFYRVFLKIVMRRFVAQRYHHSELKWYSDKGNCGGFMFIGWEKERLEKAVGCGVEFEIKSRGPKPSQYRERSRRNTKMTHS
jgi:hypothetical protein